MLIASACLSRSFGWPYLSRSFIILSRGRTGAFLYLYLSLLFSSPLLFLTIFLLLLSLLCFLLWWPPWRLYDTVLQGAEIFLTFHQFLLHQEKGRKKNTQEKISKKKKKVCLHRPDILFLRAGLSRFYLPVPWHSIQTVHPCFLRVFFSLSRHQTERWVENACSHDCFNKNENILVRSYILIAISCSRQ